MEYVKPEFENLPDLAEAFEAVKGQLFGPLDPALVKLKHKEIIQDARDRREQDLDPRGRLGLARDDHAERDRRDRDHNVRTLTWLLANDRAYREAHERAAASFTNAGNAIDRAIEAGEKAHESLRRQIDGYLTSTARLSDGRYVMIDVDGTYKDETGKPITPEDASEVEGQPIKTFRPYEVLTERKARIERDLDELRGWSVEVGDMHNKANDDENPASREELSDLAERADDLAARAKEKQNEFEQSSPGLIADHQLGTVEPTGSTATMAMPQLP
ncbi:hypothetical protein W911_06045 [Hyphomicrobium nitrativorans NL23]|uniref:Uncharacterized protein n=1 Tax=Hyphomicrobium nitrativorans NL23 TaxID=1029756 RepID=V5SHN8_9HYPH|nr:hypothetical protein [Hyphomicrobium nitrativorans]AHB50017.1 hypothetical protein W911_06045 [Hyphomicrobium nitrativorans NL23]